jgi:EAL domain-containing protein (putative c-di-GMP-specific phosphodiesterase class I)
MELANNHLVHLRDIGFLVALDDFGSGYSSLSYLTSMPVDIVKFDIALIHSLHDDTHRRLVEHLLEFISSAGQETVAEGVEDEVCLQRVRELGFSYVQGYLWGRPQPLSPPLSLSASPG